MEQIEPLLRRKSTETLGLWQIFPPRACRYGGEKFFVHGFSDETSPHSNTLILSKSPKRVKFEDATRVPYQDIELSRKRPEKGLDETLIPTRTLLGWRLIEDSRGIPAMMVSDLSFCRVRMFSYDLSHYIVGPRTVRNSNKELQSVPKKDVILFI